MNFELTKEYVEQIEELIASQNVAAIRSEMEALYPADITNLLIELDTEPAKYLLDKLNIDTGAEILADLDQDDRRLR